MTCVDGRSRAQYGQGAIQLVGSEKTSVPWAFNRRGSCLGSRRSGGSAKVHTRFSDDVVKRVVPSVDL